MTENDPASHDPGEDARALVAALADARTREPAFRTLQARGEAARAAVHEGLGDGRFEVRRWCALWLFEHPDPSDAPALAPLVRDPRRAVRQAAMVALAVAHGEAAEVAPLLIERALTDESLRMRRQAVSLLAWRLAHPDLEGFFAELAERESDAKIARYARAGARMCRARAEEGRSC